MYKVCEGIHLTTTAKDGFDGVLELMFFTDSDHGGNADGSSTLGMMAFMNGNYFRGYSSGQKCLTLNTAESEYIAMAKCLQFAIWTMLLLREMNFKVRFPIPILADNVCGSDIDCKVANTHEICTAYIPPHALYPIHSAVSRFHSSPCGHEVELQRPEHEGSSTTNIPTASSICAKWTTPI
jgi:hypothetical protein